MKKSLLPRIENRRKRRRRPSTMIAGKYASARTEKQIEHMIGDGKMGDERELVNKGAQTVIQVFLQSLRLKIAGRPTI
ncbi:MAG: hypothetical protein V1792_27835 [Pseudomonadota bacterium]